MAERRGPKRPAEADPEGPQRLTKKFNLLSLEHDGKLYAPVSDAPSVGQTQVLTDDYMQVEDTKDKIYIHSLDEELAGLSEEPDADGNLVFLPDIEKHLTAIPKHLLGVEQSHSATSNNELVLYRLPSSLTVPEEKDSVRKAIIESRARASRQRARINGAVQGYNGNFEANSHQPSHDNVHHEGYPPARTGVSNTLTVDDRFYNGQDSARRDYLVNTPIPSTSNLYPNGFRKSNGNEHATTSNVPHPQDAYQNEATERPPEDVMELG